MTGHGNLKFFTSAPIGSPFEFVPAICNVLRPQGAWAISAFHAPDRSWEAFQSRLAGRDSLADRLEQDNSELVCDGASANEIPRYLGGPHGELVSLAECEAGQSILLGVERDVPSTVRGKFTPSDASIRTGLHDVFSTLDGPLVRGEYAGTYYGRATFSVSFFGYGVPKDRQAARAAILAVPEVHAVQRNLESVLGPLQCVIVWSI